MTHIHAADEIPLCVNVRHPPIHVQVRADYSANRLRAAMYSAFNCSTTSATVNT